MVDIEKSIADCCKQLRLSSNFSSQAMTQKGESQQEYLLNPPPAEKNYRLRLVVLFVLLALCGMVWYTQLSSTNRKL